jgi:hypothetical protein
MLKETPPKATIGLQQAGDYSRNTSLNERAEKAATAEEQGKGGK